MSAPAAVPGYLWAHEVAALLHVTPKTATRWAATDKLPHVRGPNGYYLFPEREVRKLAAALATPKHPQQPAPWRPPSRQDGPL